MNNKTVEEVFVWMTISSWAIQPAVQLFQTTELVARIRGGVLVNLLDILGEVYARAKCTC